MFRSFTEPGLSGTGVLRETCLGSRRVSSRAVVFAQPPIDPQLGSVHSIPCLLQNVFVFPVIYFSSCMHLKIRAVAETRQTGGNFRESGSWPAFLPLGGPGGPTKSREMRAAAQRRLPTVPFATAKGIWRTLEMERVDTHENLSTNGSPRTPCHRLSGHIFVTSKYNVT